MEKSPSVTTWFLMGFLAFPVVTLAHECGHLLIGYLFHWPGPALHYASASFADEEEVQRLINSSDFTSAAKIHPLWQVALSNIAGPLVSVLIILGTAIWTNWRGPQPLTLALGFAAAGRFVAPLATGAVLLVRWLLSVHGPFHPTIDEYSCGLHLGVPPAMVIFLSLTAAACCLFWLLAGVWRRELRWPLTVLVTGITCGAVAYFYFLGPILLP